MKQELFEQYHQGEWHQHELLVKAIKNNAAKEKEMDQFPHSFRRICHHLALARDRCYTSHLIDRLNHMVLDSHHIMYEAPKVTQNAVLKFLQKDFPRAVRREAKMFWLANLLFYGPYFLTCVLVILNPEFVFSILPSEQVHSAEDMYNPDNWTGRDPGADMLMFGHYIQNNVSIGFRTFASGILACVGSIFYLLLNGLMIGAVTGHLLHVGYHETFIGFVIAHGSFELTAIVLSGLCGLRMGLSLIIPGNRSRKLAIMETAKDLLPIIYGFTLMFVLAAFVEAFWSPRILPFEVKIVIGTILWIAVAAYFLFSGRTIED